jgi:ribosomal protein S18 acetylase RimI-like enzyme
MSGLSLSMRNVISDPFDRPQVETVRFAMYRNLHDIPPCRPLPPGYELHPWNLRSVAPGSAVLKIAFTSTPDASLYTELKSDRGCGYILEELTELPGFLPEASWIISLNNAPCAVVLSHQLPGLVGQISVVAVTPQHRKRGLATNLIRKALWTFQEMGLLYSILYVNRSNRNAIRFFRSLNYQVSASCVYK